MLILSLPPVVSLYLSFLSRNKEAMLGKGHVCRILLQHDPETRGDLVLRLPEIETSTQKYMKRVMDFRVLSHEKCLSKSTKETSQHS